MQVYSQGSSGHVSSHRCPVFSQIIAMHRAFISVVSMPSSSRIFFASALLGKDTEQGAAGATAPVPSLESFGSIMIFGVAARAPGAVPELGVLDQMSALSMDTCSSSVP